MRHFIINFLAQEPRGISAFVITHYWNHFPTVAEINAQISAYLAEARIEVMGNPMFTGICEVSEADRDSFIGR